MGAMMSIYVLVADSSKARILSVQDSNSPLLDKHDFIHSDSRFKERDLVSGEMGNRRDSGGFGKHSMGHEGATHQLQAELFARDLCSEVEKIRATGDLRRIYLIAAPKMLGILRHNLNKQCSELVSGEVNRNLVNHDLKDIRSHLPKRL